MMLRGMFGPEIGDRRMIKSSTMRKVIIGTGSNAWNAWKGWKIHTYGGRYSNGYQENTMPRRGLGSSSGREKWQSLVNRAVIRGVDKERRWPRKWLQFCHLLERNLLHQTCYLERRERWQNSQWIVATVRTRDTSGSKWRELDRKYRTW